MTDQNLEARKSARLRDVFYMYLGGIAIFTIAVVPIWEVECKIALINLRSMLLDLLLLT